MIDTLRIVLGTAFALYFKTHAAHWNCVGPDFYQLHKMLEEQYTDIWESIDDIAEEIRKIDYFVSYDALKCLSYSKIEPLSEIPDMKNLLIILVADNEKMIEILKNAFAEAEQENNQGLMNFLADRMDKHSKFRWMLRATAR